MPLPSLKTASSFLISTAVVLLILFCDSCKKVSNDETNETPFVADTSKATIRDLTTKINSSVSGFVTDENGSVIIGAAIKVGISNTVTDKYGFFEIKNVQVVKEAAVVSVEKIGYLKGIKTYIATEGKSAFFRIQLLLKTFAGTVDATTGGNVASPSGLKIVIPANAVVNALTKAIYNGPVTVNANWIDPEDNKLALKMPGDLRGLDSTGKIKLLTTYGMAAVELMGANGELLQIAASKKSNNKHPNVS